LLASTRAVRPKVDFLGREGAKEFFGGPVGRKPLKSRESRSEMEEKGRKRKGFSVLFACVFRLSAGARCVLEGIFAAVRPSSWASIDARRLRRKPLRRPLRGLLGRSKKPVGTPQTRKWRRKVLKRLNSRPEMVWPSSLEPPRSGAAARVLPVAPRPASVYTAARFSGGLPLRGREMGA
jgi:hypothetical protein